MATKRKKKSAAKPRRAKPAAAKSLNLSSVAPGVTVRDIHRSLAWYCDVLGFKVTQRWEREGTLRGAEVAAGAVTFYVAQDDWQKGRDRVKGEGFRLYCYCKTRKAVDHVAVAIKTRGGTLSSEPRDEWGTRSFNLEDPDGFKITISSER